MLEADEAYFKEHGEPLFSSHMLDLSDPQVSTATRSVEGFSMRSEEPDEENIEICAKYLKRMAPMKQILDTQLR